MGVNGFRDLRVWQAGMDLVEHVYRVTREFPKHELYGLTGQMQRAAVSVPSNVAEGHAREHLREYLHHLSIAQASLAELQTQLEIAGRLAYLSPTELTSILGEATSLAKQLHALPTPSDKETDPGREFRSPTPNT
jgi:four helix bundle protein